MPKHAKGHGSDLKAKLWGWLLPWIKDFVDVGVTVAVIIIVLRLLLGANMLVPFVVVTSGSMTHSYGDNSWKTWMTSRGLSGELIDSFPLQNGFLMGDMIVVKSPDASLGDVVIYERDLDHRGFFGDDPIIHRVVGIIHISDWKPVRYEGTIDCITRERIDDTAKAIQSCRAGGQCPYPAVPESSSFRLFVTKGDNNEGSDQCSQRLRLGYLVNEAQVTGRGFIRLPYIGYVKLMMNAILNVFIFIIRLFTG